MWGRKDASVAAEQTDVARAENPRSTGDSCARAAGSPIQGHAARRRGGMPSDMPTARSGRPEEASGRAGGSDEGVALERISRVAAGRGAVRRANAVPVVAEEGCEQRPEGDAGQDEDRCDGHGSNSPPTENLPLVALMPTYVDFVPQVTGGSSDQRAGLEQVGLVAARRVAEAGHPTVTVVVDEDRHEGGEEGDDKEEDCEDHGANTTSVEMPP